MNRGGVVKEEVNHGIDNGCPSTEREMVVMKKAEIYRSF
jgi:hypothetical protein